MIEFADILFLITSALVLIYFFVSLVFPSFVRRYRARSTFILRIAIVLFLVSAVLYSAMNFKQRKVYSKIEGKIDSLSVQISSDSISTNRLDTLITEIESTKEDILKFEQDQEKLKKRIRMREFNRKLSDSIQLQLENLLKEYNVWKNFSDESKVAVSGDGRVLVSGGKILYVKVKEFNDLYAIDKFEYNPIPKKVDFTIESELWELHNYIDSLKISFRIIKNHGRIKRNGVDSLLFLTITPVVQDYGEYGHYESTEGVKLHCIDSLYFTADSTYNLVLDFPNDLVADTSFCLGFYLKRGKIGEFCH